MKLPKLSRRKLLSMIALLSAAPSLSVSDALAWIHGGGFSFNGGKTQTNTEGMATSGMFPFLNLLLQGQPASYISAPTAPNVPQIPLTELDANGYPTSIVAGTGGVHQFQAFYLYPTAQYSGVYVLAWDGGGTLVVPGNGTTTGYIPNTGYSFSNLTSSNSGGRYEFTLQNDSVANDVKITATSAAPNNVRNVRLYRKVDESLINAGQVFGVDFIAKMLQAKPGAIRSLGWIGSSTDGTNNCSITTWATRKPKTYFSYRAPQFFPSLYLGVSTQSGNSYTISSSAPTDKQIGHFFVTAPPANCTQTTCAISNSSVTGLPAAITINSHNLVVGDIVTLGSTGGAVPSPFVAGTTYYVQNVVDTNNVNLTATLGGSAISTTAAGTSVVALLWMSLSLDGGTTRYVMTGQFFPASNQTTVTFSAGKLAANQTATFVFDQTTQTFVLTVDPTGSAGNVGFWNGVPPETFVDFCAKVGANPWIIAPYLTMETASGQNNVTDFIPSMLSYVSATYPWMKPAIEPPNETWNGGSVVFRSTPYSIGVAWARWQLATDPTNEVYGSWASKLARNVAAFYGGDYSKFLSICAFQTSPWFSGGSGGQSKRLLASRYVTANGGNNSFAAYNQCNAVCAATYFSPAERFQCQEVIDGFGWTVTNAGNPSGQSTIAEGYTATLSSGTVPYTIAYVIQCFNNIITYVETLTGNIITTVVAYEGGYSPDYLGTSSSSGNGNAWKTVIAAATQANPCVLTLASTTNSPEQSSITGNPAVVGAGISPTGATGMTGLNLADSITATFTASSANITLSTGTFAVGSAVIFNNWSNNINGGAMPAPLVQGQPYYVVSSVGSVIQVSATKGGSAITITALGNLTIQVQQCYVITAVSGSSVTIDYDASVQSAYTANSGTANFTFSGSLSNNLRYAGKFTNNLGTQNTSFIAAWNALSGLNPKYFSNFTFFGTGTVWPVLDPNIYAANTPQWNSIVAANN